MFFEEMSEWFLFLGIMYFPFGKVEKTIEIVSDFSNV